MAAGAPCRRASPGGQSAGASRDGPRTDGCAPFSSAATRGAGVSPAVGSAEPGTAPRVSARAEGPCGRQLLAAGGAGPGVVRPAA
jgi:hypothetical protein